MEELPTCHPGDYRRGRGLPFAKLAVGEVFHGVGCFGKQRTYVKVCPWHAVPISHVSEADYEFIRNDCTRVHLLIGRADLRKCCATFEEESRVRPAGRRMFAPDAAAEATWAEEERVVAEMLKRSAVGLG